MNKPAPKPVKKRGLKRFFIPDFPGPIQPAAPGVRNTRPEDVTRALEAIFRRRTAAAQA